MNAARIFFGRLALRTSWAFASIAEWLLAPELRRL